MTEITFAHPELSSKAARAESNQVSPKGKNAKLQRKSSTLPNETVEYLKAWMMSPEHIAHPYPTEEEKAQIMADTGVELKQLTNWFVNNRKRYWKPRVEARLQQQAQAAAAVAQAHAAAVAAMTAATRVNPVTPDSGFKPTLNLETSVNGFLTFDVGVTQPPNKMTIPLVGTDFARIWAARNPVRTVSETSSSASVSASEGDISDSPSEDDFPQDATTSENTCRASEVLVQTQSLDNKSQNQSSGESLSQDPATLNTNAPSKRLLKAEECVPSPRKKFRRESLELWRDACLNATNVYDDNLPTLEEASRLFGYAC